MANLFDLLVSGLATGAIYALVAVGFTLLWQTSQTINFAQGEFVMLPAFLMLAAMRAGAPFWLAILSASAVAGAARLRLQAAAGRSDAAPRRVAAGDRDDGARRSAMKEVGQAVLQRRGVAVSVRRPAGDRCRSSAHHGLAAEHRRARLLAIVAVVGSTLFLEPHLDRPSDAGGRAESDGRPHRRHSGRAHDALTFLINAPLVALASLLVTPIYLAKFSSGEALGQAAFAAAIVGGFNQVRGAIVGGLLIGVVDNLAAAYVSTQYRAAVPLVAADRRHPVSARKDCSGRPRNARYDPRQRNICASRSGVVVLAGLIVVPLSLQSLWALHAEPVGGDDDRRDGA